MKIAMIDPSLFTLPYDLALCRALVATGCDVTLYGREVRLQESVGDVHAPGASFYRLSEPLKKHTPARLFQIAKGLEHVADMARLARRLRREPPSVVHCQWTPLPSIDIHAVRYIRRTVAPIVLTVHDVKPFNNSPTSALQRIGSMSVWHEFDHLIVHSESSRTTLTELGIANNRISVIPHGVLETAAAAKEPSRKSGPLTVLLFGRIKSYKGVDVMIEAVGRLSEKLRSQCRFLVVGEPMIPMGPVMDRAAALGISGNIVWDLRYVSDGDMTSVFDQADIFAFPYREIDTSGVLMSCLPFARPIIASSIGAFATLLKDGIHGRVVPPDNPEALAKAIASLLTNPALLRSCGENVGRLAEQIPSWDMIAAQTTTVYTSLIRERAEAIITPPSRR